MSNLIAKATKIHLKNPCNLSPILPTIIVLMQDIQHSRKTTMISNPITTAFNDQGHTLVESRMPRY
uniref:Uncharacterized protein n=1 Tax=Rhizophora mucronata TaxID=61149 RepID=A0A2P2KJY2_RHIMU